jgi:hypothetical protein
MFWKSGDARLSERPQGHRQVTLVQQFHARLSLPLLSVRHRNMEMADL